MYDNKRKVVLSLYDFTGEALKPWAQAGYECYAFDIQHDDQVVETYEGGGSIHYRHADLHDPTYIQCYTGSVSTMGLCIWYGLPCMYRHGCIRCSTLR
jgi:hypothetical protein